MKFGKILICLIVLIKLSLNRKLKTSDYECGKLKGQCKDKSKPICCRRDKMEYDFGFEYNTICRVACFDNETEVKEGNFGKQKID